MAEEELPQFAEDDDLARAKRFWSENGKSIVAGILIGLAGIGGFNYWKIYEKTQGEEASVLFEQLRSGEEGINFAEITSDLKENYKSTGYSDLAAFTMAKQFVDAGELDSASKELSWVLENTQVPGFKHIARLRLGAVYLAKNQPEEVLALLNNIDKSSFVSRYDELVGDAYAKRGQNGDVDLAQKAYQQSLETLPSGSTHGRLIQLKIDNVGEN